MSWFSDIFSGGAKGIIDGVKGIADEFHLSGEEKQAFQLKTQELLQSRLSELEQTARKELEAKERIITAEMNQADNYTKRARPTIVYAGLSFIFFNFTVAPVLGFGTLDLPTEFWVAWGGVVGTWSVGRSAEKVGVKNAFTKKVTGGNKSLLGD